MKYSHNKFRKTSNREKYWHKEGRLDRIVFPKLHGICTRVSNMSCRPLYELGVSLILRSWPDYKSKTTALWYMPNYGSLFTTENICFAKKQVERQGIANKLY